MASYNPPLEILPIFNQNVFISSDSTLTISQADKRYLKFPLGQGTETLPKLIVNGISSIFNTSRLFKNTQGTSYIETNTILNSSTGTTPTGWFNSFFGHDAGKSITSGGTNTGVGEFETLLSLTTGSSNCAYGNSALKSTTINSFSTAVGYGAGYTSDASYNTFLGANSDVSFSNINNSTAIGAGSIISESNTVVLGRSSEKVVIPNQIKFNYSSLPTYGNTSIGYTNSYTWSSVLTVVGGAGLTVASYDNLPIGVYIFSSNFLNFGVNGATRNDYILSHTNITNLSCGSTLEFAGNSVGKINVTLCCVLQVTSAINSLLYKYTFITGAAGTIQPSSATVLRIA